MNYLPDRHHVASSAYEAVPSILDYVKRTSRTKALEILRDIYNNAVTLRAFTHLTVARPAEGSQIAKIWFRRRFLTLANALIIIWIFCLYLGEVSVFNKSIGKCDWSGFENWPPDATPHHLVFVADPQLVDPHTYPGRPWPLSSLTIRNTDNYLRRAYSRIQRELQPDTIFFLGDLFDGGREWSTDRSESPDKRWHGYKHSYWQKEYDRFSRIFFRDWAAYQRTTEEDLEDFTDRTTIIASLPGNHDLGFSSGIQEPVRDRFNAYFGDSNRFDIIGNHTFVSIDTVSLSAKDAQTEQDVEKIWKPADSFLDNARRSLGTKLGHYIVTTKELKPEPPFKRKHLVEEVDGSEFPEYRSEDVFAFADFPMILLSHVPLYRNPGTPCGPLRERHPPTAPPAGQTEPVDPDVRNAINSLGSGTQYQNTISRGISLSVIERLGGAVQHVFSGDDHDYCDIVHRAYPSRGSGIRETTVKSMSWAMGVRKPGFLLVSLWNEVDINGKRIRTSDEANEPTIQTSLCLLPDQLTILIRYVLVLGLSVGVLFIRAVMLIFTPNKLPLSTPEKDIVPLLPTNSYGSKLESRSNERSSFPENGSVLPAGSISSSSDDSMNGTKLSARNTRPRSISPLPSYGYGFGTPSTPSQLPAVGPTSQTRTRPGWEIKEKAENHDEWPGRGRKPRTRRIERPKGKLERMIIEWGWSLFRVARVVLPVYVWFQWR